MAAPRRVTAARSAGPLSPAHPQPAAGARTAPALRLAVPGLLAALVVVIEVAKASV